MKERPREYAVMHFEQPPSYGLDERSGEPWRWRIIIDAVATKNHARRMRRRFPGILIKTVKQ